VTIDSLTFILLLSQSSNKTVAELFAPEIIEFKFVLLVILNS